MRWKVVSARVVSLISGLRSLTTARPVRLVKVGSLSYGSTARSICIPRALDPEETSGIGLRSPAPVARLLAVPAVRAADPPVRLPEEVRGPRRPAAGYPGVPGARPVPVAGDPDRAGEGHRRLPFVHPGRRWLRGPLIVHRRRRLGERNRGLLRRRRLLLRLRVPVTLVERPG